jgi:hypothetical protein
MPDSLESFSGGKREAVPPIQQGDRRRRVRPVVAAKEIGRSRALRTAREEALPDAESPVKSLF